VDVHDDVAIGVLRLEHEQLRHHVVGGGVVHLDAEEDDAVLEELRVRVLALEAVGRALLEGRQDVAGFGQVAERRRRPGHVQVGHRRRVPYLVPPPPMTSAADSRMWSTKPYSRASWALNQRSRSPSALICSTVLPVASAVISASRRFMSRMSAAWVWMSLAV